MEAQSAGAPRPVKGRVVMLVDNKVDGDSRVQKAAESAAAAGWDVVLLGLVRSGNGRSWKLGDAEVRLLPLKTPLAKRHAERHRSPLRRPLAYPPGPMAAYRRQWVKAWRADVATRRAALKVAPKAVGSPMFRKAEKARLTVAGPVSKFMQKWVGFRARQSSQAQKAGRALHGPVDRAFTATWKAVKGKRAWRRLEPVLWDYELTYGAEIDALEPDLIHANDFRMLGVGARAAVRARAKGRTVKLVWDAHEFLPGVRPWEDNAHWIPGNTAHESEYAPFADAVVTVSEGLADLLRERHGLAEQPTVVLNAPDRPVERDPAIEDTEPEPDLRELCGIGPDVPLVVYSGSPGAQRGLGDMVEALPKLDGVHMAFVVPAPAAGYIQGLLARARELGVGDRLHAVPYVKHWQVVRFLSAANVGCIPIHHWPNHEIALITKFFEYSHARLPLVVSDVKTMSEVTRATGQGEVCRAEDVDDLARAIKAVLADPEKYRATYDKPGLLDTWTWEAQAEVLDGLYTRLVPRNPKAGS
ncbi:glycosyltransferase family 4 protein [Streptomyces sp. FL07-04A]|uniref:glycosyltransferase family 4 protein n=1 Tax=Streptomyces sp. FL07-04A TaxID=3028658 RepID=UPI0029A900FB|nr:glycosyltransferase family 4 protein [Streptomyces sp. FL07-04A]MDX3577669.1 glycosyltransferase family 4 protein [Streptomyces sp. FL07-04A]